MAANSADTVVSPYRRAQDGKMLAGVAAGLAEHLRLRPIVVRLWFVGLTAVCGFGIVLYAALWIPVPQATPDPTGPAGRATAERLGMRTRSWRARVGDMGQLAALAVLAIGLLVLAHGVGIGVDARLYLPAAVIGVGLVLVWRQTDAAERRDWARTRGVPIATAVLQADGNRAVLRIGAGVAAVLIGIGAYVATSVRPADLSRLLVAIAVVVAGLVLIVGPWLLRLVRQLGAERNERILSQERADVAAHLHDSVLQTLALIQRQAEDPREVVRLARSQERDHRNWLYGATAATETSLQAAMHRAAAEVEERYGVPIEVVAVGDREADARTEPLVLAAREALVNAAKHSHAARVDVFAEIGADEATVFVRDRGVGFDAESVPADRLGVRNSILARMQRHGGTAQVRSEPGEGTEVRLTMPWAPKPPPPTGPSAPGAAERDDDEMGKP
jgi:signal transduction histidine kinase/phage shock protein PspC (stress-responsive transcriptional regulator)